MAGEPGSSAPRRPWRAIFRGGSDETVDQAAASGMQPIPKWTMGMLNDRETIEVPGSVLLLSEERNEPLGLQNAPARTSHSSLPVGIPPEPPTQPSEPGQQAQKLTKDGQIILQPQPDDSHNDPLNWPAWRRDSALISLGLFCMVGGGITPIIAAGFTNVARDFNIDVARVSLTTGLYMLGLGLGCVIWSPTAILFGKRPVYLFGAILFILSAVWCALSKTFTSFILARIFQGIAVSPVECLPSATIAEIFFLHERAFRIGIYTLLLLGGKNLVPLVSAVIIDLLDWRWVFWIVAIVVGFCGISLFFFVPETFWDRTPIPKSTRRADSRPKLFSRRSSRNAVPQVPKTAGDDQPTHESAELKRTIEETEVASTLKERHVGFAPAPESHVASKTGHDVISPPAATGLASEDISSPHEEKPESASSSSQTVIAGDAEKTDIHKPETVKHDPAVDLEAQHRAHFNLDSESERMSFSNLAAITLGQLYTHKLREAPRQSFRSQLKIHNGRLNHDKWWKVAFRPFVLFSYPAVLWSSALYACSVGWLIVISECVAVIYREGHYKFSALSTGLVYVSPFIGGILGSAVAGKVSDVVVQAMARRNGGLYEPEFRLVMVAPIAITTVLGLIGFGWSAYLNDSWIVPTLFFGIVSFGCSLGSTTAITFCVDSYRQYAGEALVTLNFSKNVLHGLVFSLFVTGWLKSDGPKTVFIWIGVIQLIILLTTIPMYIYGKRARMWTVRMNFMENF